MSRPLPLSRTVLTSTCRPASSSRRVRHNSMPLSGTCGRCVSPMCERRRLSIPYANAWSGSCRNSLSLWRFREFQPTIISRSAAFVPWSLPAKSVGAPGAPKEVRPVWGLPPSLAPGWHNNSILSTNVWLPSLPNLLWVKPEQYLFYHVGGFKGSQWYNRQLDKIRSKRDKCKKKSRRYIHLSKVYKRVAQKKRNKQRDSLH